MRRIAFAAVVAGLIASASVRAVDLATFWPGRAPVAWTHLEKTDQANYYYGVYDDPPWGTVLVIKIGQYNLTGGYSSIELDAFRFKCQSASPPNNVGVLMSQTFDPATGELLGQVVDDNSGMLATPIRPHTILADAIIASCKVETRREARQAAQAAYDQRLTDTLLKMTKAEIAKTLECYGVPINKVEDPILPIPAKDECVAFLRKRGLDPNANTVQPLRLFELLPSH